MKSFIKLFFSALLFLSTVSTIHSVQKLKIGLVLSGGGAKGLAHVGVLKILEKAGIKVDIITGTSMGALIGALYASGYTADQLEAIIRQQNWSRLIFDILPRDQLRMNDKKSDGRYFIDFGLQKGKLTTGGGLTRGQRVNLLLSKLTWPIHHIRNFHKLPIPFACIAADLQTGQPVVLTNGFLPDAMRASMSIPSVFNPVDLNNRLLVDGGIVRNFPVNEAIKMGANFIIGVDVSDPPKSKKELKNMFVILSKISMFRNQKDLKKQRALCNILIKPNIKGFTSGDFGKAEHLIAIGETAAKKALPALKKLAEKIPANKLSKRTDIANNINKPFILKKILIPHVSKTQRIQINNILRLKINKKITAKEIESRINTLYGSGLFEKAIFEIEPITGGKQIIIHVKKATDHRIRFGLHFDTETDGELLVNGLFKNILGQWSQLEITVTLGVNYSIEGNLLFDSSMVPWFQFGTGVILEHREFFIYENDLIDEAFNYDYGVVSLFIQSLNNRHIQYKIALKKEFAQITPKNYKYKYWNRNTRLSCSGRSTKNRYT